MNFDKINFFIDNFNCNNKSIYKIMNKINNYIGLINDIDEVDRLFVIIIIINKYIN